MFQKSNLKMTVSAAVLALTILSAGAKNLSVTITGADGRPISGFLVGATQEGIRIAANESGQGVSEIKQSEVSEITFNEMPEGWQEANVQFKAGDFVNAEGGFTALAEKYKGIGLLKDKYGAMARYYQLMCLKENRKLPQLAAALGVLRTHPIALSEHYMKILIGLKPWGLVGKEDWDGVLAIVSENQESSDRPRAKFKAGVTRSQIAELSYLAGLAQIRKGEKERGLENLYRSLTLNNGSDLNLSKAAITEALEQLKEADSDELKREAYAIATFYRAAIGKGSIEPEFMHLLKALPPLPEPEAAEGAEGAEGAEAAEAAEAADGAEE